MPKGSFGKLIYRFVEPKNNNPDMKYPLILCLHGMRGKGIDNIDQLRSYVEQFTTDKLRTKHPHYFLAPQTAGVWINSQNKGKEIPLEEINQRMGPNLKKPIEKYKRTYS